nr:electron transport complex subunit RsxC [bacterium]
MSLFARRFAGGVHPLASLEEGKPLTNRRPIRAMAAPATVYIPLSQHIGAPCTATVQVGERVLRHQVIGRPPEGALGAPVHASVSGTVVSIQPMQQLSGRVCSCVVIQNDFLDEAAPCDWKTGAVEQLTPQEIIAAARGAGLVGMGGASFPLAVKLSPPPGKQVDTVIINGAECEPYLTCDHRTLVEQAGDVVCGLRAAMKALGAKNGIIAIEKNKPDAIASLQQATRPYGDISVLPLRVRYPQGAEKQVIYAALGRVVPMGGLPLDVGVVVCNTGTMAALCAALRGTACDERVVTVSGTAVRQPDNLRVRVGTPIGDVFAACGGFSEEPRKILSGGPMMGFAQYDITVPVVKATSGLLAFGEREAWLPEESACIRCGMCLRACPMRLNPSSIYDAQRTGNLEKAKKLSAQGCMECGCCAYICPAHRPLVQGIRLAKAAILAQNKK